MCYFYEFLIMFSICLSIPLPFSVPIFKSFPEETLIKISDVLEETHYQPGDYIVSDELKSGIFEQRPTNIFTSIFDWIDFVVGPTRCSWRYIFHHIKRNGSRYDSSVKFARREIHSSFGQRRFLRWKSITRVNWLTHSILLLSSKCIIA